MERRLSAILVADVVGYSRLMEADESGTLEAVKERKASVLEPIAAAHGGRIVKEMGDGFLIKFSSAVGAVSGALEFQRRSAEENDRLSDDQRIVLRIGINLGDVIEKDGDIFGEGVNIASRLESLADPGGICISAKVHDEVQGKIPVTFDDMGEQTVKNISRPLRAYRCRNDDLAAGPYVIPLRNVSDKPSIAVLPFKNMSGDPEQEYFGDGIAEDIITALSKLRGVLVIARNSTFSYKEKAPTVTQIAGELGVRYVLEGSVRTAGERLRVTGQLIDAKSGNHIWAERYERPAADIFALQDEITTSVVAAIEPQLYAAENLRLQSRSPDSLDAWGCVVRAMPYIWTWVSQNNDAGIKLLNRAIELDPGYARARSLLAWIFATRVTLGNMDYERGISDAFALAQRAIDLDPEDPWGHVANGYVCTFSRRFAPAVEELNEALQRNPSFSFARMILAVTYGYAGLAEEGYRQLEIARQLSPRDYTQAANFSVEGLCHLVSGRYDDAVTAERRAVQLRPDFGTAWRTLTAAAGLAGDLELARRGLLECKRLQPNVSIAWIERYYPMIRADDRAKYVEGLRRAGLE